MFYHYATVTSFFGALRQLVSTLGYRGFRPYQDEIAGLVGFKHNHEIFCIKVSTVRHYYNAIYEGENAPQKEARMFARDVQSILEERSNVSR